MPKQRVNICVSPDLWQRTRQFAQAHRTSAGAVIEEALQRLLEDDERQLQVRRQAVGEIFALDLGPLGTPEELLDELESVYDEPPGGGEQ